MSERKEIKVEANVLSKKCDDKKCPIHNGLSLRGRVFRGKVVSKDTHKTARVQLSRIRPVRKYERFEHRTSKFSVHNPLCLDCNVGDDVKIVECRPISKTKKFVIIEKLK